MTGDTTERTSENGSETENTRTPTYCGDLADLCVYVF